MVADGKVVDVIGDLDPYETHRAGGQGLGVHGSPGTSMARRPKLK